MQKEHASKSPSTAEDVADVATLRGDADATNLDATRMDLTPGAGAQGSTKAQRNAKLSASTSPAGPRRPAGKGTKLKTPTPQTRQDKSQAQGIQTASSPRLSEAEAAQLREETMARQMESSEHIRCKSQRGYVSDEADAATDATLVQSPAQEELNTVKKKQVTVVTLNTEALMKDRRKAPPPPGALTGTIPKIPAHVEKPEYLADETVKKHQKK